jgi:hypothetical protein
MTNRNRNGTVEQILAEMRRLLNGWLGYYRIADMEKDVQRMSEWLRRRLRQLYWKRGKTRQKNLMQLGVSRDKAWQWANTRKGHWRIAGSCILTTTLTNRYFETIGFLNILKRYEELREQAKRLEMLYGTC